MEFTVLTKLAVSIPTSVDTPPTAVQLYRALVELRKVKEAVSFPAIRPAAIWNSWFEFTSDFWGEISDIYPLFNWLYHQLTPESEFYEFSVPLFSSLMVLFDEPTSFQLSSGSVNQILQKLSIVLGPPSRGTPDPLWYSREPIPRIQLGSHADYVDYCREKSKTYAAMAIENFPRLINAIESGGVSFDDPLGLDTIFDEGEPSE